MYSADANPPCYVLHGPGLHQPRELLKALSSIFEVFRQVLNALLVERAQQRHLHVNVNKTPGGAATVAGWESSSSLHYGTAFTETRMRGWG